MSIFRTAVLLGCLGVTLSAQTAVVERKTNLRKDPSAKHAPVATLLPDDKLTIVDTAGAPDYLHVKTEEGQVGFVYKNFVQVAAPPPATTPASTHGAATAATTTSTTTPAAAGGSGGIADAIDPSWDKPAPVAKPFAGSEGTCAETGDGGDTATNLRKNRIDALPAVHNVTWSAINSLAYPAAKPSRLNWTPAQLAQIKSFEGAPLRVVGYLSHQVKVETEGKGESTNCHFTQAQDVDWHIYLTQEPNQPISKAVIIETTPRIRAGHNWDPEQLRKWVNQDKPVRISGFLMLDPEHRDVVGTQRGTVWEIHPVMKIEVCNSSSCTEGDWKDIETIR
jgi:hypothetical protein